MPQEEEIFFSRITMLYDIICRMISQYREILCSYRTTTGEFIFRLQQRQLSVPPPVKGFPQGLTDKDQQDKHAN